MFFQPVATLSFKLRSLSLKCITFNLCLGNKALVYMPCIACQVYIDNDIFCVLNGARNSIRLGIVVHWWYTRQKLVYYRQIASLRGSFKLNATSLRILLVSFQSVDSYFLVERGYTTYAHCQIAKESTWNKIEKNAACGILLGWQCYLYCLVFVGGGFSRITYFYVALRRSAIHYPPDLVRFVLDFSHLIERS